MTIEVGKVESIPGSSAASGDPTMKELKRIDKQKLIAWKNLLCLSLSFMLLFTAFNALQSLQSSLHRDPHLGVVSLSVIYASLLVSCLLLPSLVIEKLGCKLTLAVSCCGYVAYTAAHLHPTWWTLIPAAVLLGCSAASLWSAQGNYVTSTAIKYASLNHEVQDEVIAKFFGLFNTILFSNQIWGNLIASSVLKSTESEFVYNASSNLTLCAANFCPSMSISASKTASPGTVRILTIIYLVCGVVAALMMLFLLDQLTEREKQSKASSLLLATFRNMRTKKALLLVPFAIFTGIDAAFLAAEFTKAYVTCVLGIEKVGLAMICNGLSMTLASALLARMSKLVGRLQVVVGAAVLHLTLLIVLRTYATTIQPTDAIYLYFVVAGLWGLCDGVWQTIVRVLFGVSFPTDNAAAFSTMNVWQSLGFASAFGYSGYLCTDVKIYIVAAGLFLAVMSCVFLEVEIKKSAKDEEERENMTGILPNSNVIENIVN